MWTEINGKLYFFGIKSYRLMKGILTLEDGTYYLDQKTGERKTGMIEIGDNYYYFNKTTGKEETGLKEINGLTYYFDDVTGKRAKGITEVNGKKYFFGIRTGKMMKGWVEYDGCIYYMDPETGEVAHLWTEINGKLYFFGIKSYRLMKGILTLEDGTYYLDQKTGERKYGFQQANNGFYYFDYETGKMLTGSKKIDGIDYVFNNDGTLKGGWHIINGNTYYLQSNGYYLTGWHIVMGEKCFFNSLGQLIGKNVKRIIDVSKFQGEIDWYALKNSNTIDGVILRIGLGSTIVDQQAQRNIQKLNELNIPYGIYLFSYAENSQEAIWEADYTNRLIKEYGVNPTLGVYLDIEKWTTHADASDNISQATYEAIITTYINRMSNYGYTARVYTGKNYALNRLTELARSYVTWIAQYNYVCNYPGSYRIWQYGSEYYLGINGKVDTNVMFN